MLSWIFAIAAGVVLGGVILRLLFSEVGAWIIVIGSMLVLWLVIVLAILAGVVFFVLPAVR